MTKKKKKSKPDHHLSENEKRLLKGLYTNLSSPAAFGSIKNLQKASGLSIQKVRKFLRTSKTYTKFKQAVRKFKRRSIHALGVNHIWSVDVAYVDKLHKKNDGVKYLLVAVDVFSRFLRVQPMKDKTAKETLRAFKLMLNYDKLQYPVKVWVDQGTEFAGVFKDYCSSNKLDLYHTFSDTKSCVAERFIRTLKNVLYRYMEEFDTLRYLRQLQKIVKMINLRPQTSLNDMAPADITISNMHNVYLSRVDHRNKPARKNAHFKKGDTVRISLRNMSFKKGYRPNYTDEVFTIKKVHIPLNTRFDRDPITYTLLDKTGEVILGRFYAQELTPFSYGEGDHRPRHQVPVNL